jgi:hypothetical protein
VTVPRVFISHATGDRLFIEQELLPRLHEHDIETWYSVRDVPMAQEWERVIRSALKECDWFLVVLSPEAVLSEWVRAEVHWAFESRQGRIVPLLLRPCNYDELHLRLPTIQHTDFTGDRETGFARLLATWGKGPGAGGVPDQDDFDFDALSTLKASRGPGEVVFLAIDGPFKDATFVIRIKDHAVIGRSKDAELVLRDAAVSRQHARLSVRGRAGEHEIWIADLGSSNGTFVGGENVTSPRRLALDDVIGIGDSRLIVKEIR